ncbi:unnamed protein product [Vitrella brassicaformis CCMP3155]|uniref:Uncharacterized protein n=1 Tax=Vitrella brassicaformis (strain CCMP3155) TaxID=1169540 RepID=A0A0G4GCT3_VITBC|nr:unnamed protein product [Vitrella brassicaformis CCMP3155]|eukprot:CEM26613.1 unnamed protein product [Vitrella brassicaformis CCMP3155]
MTASLELLEALLEHIIPSTQQNGQDHRGSSGRAVLLLIPAAMDDMKICRPDAIRPGVDSSGHLASTLAMEAALQYCIQWARECAIVVWYATCLRSGGALMAYGVCSEQESLLSRPALLRTDERRGGHHHTSAAMPHPAMERILLKYVDHHAHPRGSRRPAPSDEANDPPATRQWYRLLDTLTALHEIDPPQPHLHTHSRPQSAVASRKHTRTRRKSRRRSQPYTIRKPADPFAVVPAPPPPAPPNAAPSTRTVNRPSLVVLHRLTDLIRGAEIDMSKTRPHSPRTTSSKATGAGVASGSAADPKTPGRTQAGGGGGGTGGGAGGMMDVRPDASTANFAVHLVLALLRNAVSAMGAGAGAGVVVIDVIDADTVVEFQRTQGPVSHRLQTYRRFFDAILLLTQQQLQSGQGGEGGTSAALSWTDLTRIKPLV